MRSLSSVGLGLSLVFGCLLLALVAELYYLLWWKKRMIGGRDIEDDYSSPAREFMFMLCWKRSSSTSLMSSAAGAALNPREFCSSDETHVHDPQAQLHRHHLHQEDFTGPPRFLFTIKEETKEDLESEDGKSRGDNKSRKGSRSRSLSDIILNVETPFMTPLASPSCFTPPLTPMSSNSHHSTGFNPLFETSTDAEFNRMRSSPPPKFKFLRDAEDKLYKRKLMEEAQERAQKSDSVNFPSMFLEDDEEENGGFITIVANNSKYLDKEEQFQNHSTSSSQILPLASSPSTFRPSTKFQR